MVPIFPPLVKIKIMFSFFFCILFLIRFLYRWDLCGSVHKFVVLLYEYKPLSKDMNFLNIFLCVCVPFFGSRGEQIRFCFFFFPTCF